MSKPRLTMSKPRLTMSKPRLTTAQSELLLAIVDYQRAEGRELAFTHYEGRIQASRTVSGDSIATQEPFPEVSPMIFAVWHERDFVVPVESTSGLGTTTRDFVLTQEALDYADRIRKPRLVRDFLDMFDTWQSDLRTAIVAMVFTIVTNVVMNWLGLLR
jgi:hypothetical protein